MFLFRQNLHLPEEAEQLPNLLLLKPESKSQRA